MTTNRLWWITSHEIKTKTKDSILTLLTAEELVCDNRKHIRVTVVDITFPEWVRTSLNAKLSIFSCYPEKRRNESDTSTTPRSRGKSIHLAANEIPVHKLFIVYINKGQVLSERFPINVFRRKHPLITKANGRCCSNKNNYWHNRK